MNVALVALLAIQTVSCTWQSVFRAESTDPSSRPRIEGAISDLIQLALDEVKYENHKYKNRVKTMISILPMYSVLSIDDITQGFKFAKKIRPHFRYVDFIRLSKNARDRILDPQLALKDLKYSEVTAIDIINGLESMIVASSNMDQKLALLFLNLKHHFNPNSPRTYRTDTVSVRTINETRTITSWNTEMETVTSFTTTVAYPFTRTVDIVKGTTMRTIEDEPFTSVSNFTATKTMTIPYFDMPKTITITRNE